MLEHLDKEPNASDASCADAPYVLGVRSSVTERAWQTPLTAFQKMQAEGFVQRFALPETVARILIGRGVDDSDMPEFLTPRLRYLMPDPLDLQDMHPAAERLVRALSQQEKIAILGDYDVDGATSSALMIQFLRALGVEPLLHIPDRIKEGYGPNAAALEKLHAEGATLVVTVDCGTTSFAPLEWAQAHGLDVVVIDHHQAEEILPPAVAVVNPNRHDDLSGQGHLAAAGVVYLFLVYLARLLRAIPSFSERLPDLRCFLDLVALGTVCDVVPLRGLNRAYVVQGLKVLRKNQNPGLAALCLTARLSAPPEAFHLGYVLGPRINAAGRISTSTLGAQLLTCQDPLKARELAEQLDVLNKKRQLMEAHALEDADAQAQRSLQTVSESACLLVASDHWHPGIIGLLASRLKEKYHLPSFVVTYTAQGKGTGSARSIPGVDIGKIVRLAVTAGLLEKGGGHEMAAGFTVYREKEAAFHAHLQTHTAQMLSAAGVVRSLSIDAILTARGVTEQLMTHIDQAGPYGAGYPSPVLAFPNHRLTYADAVGESHIRFCLQSTCGANLTGIAFRSMGTPLGDFLLKSRHQLVHAAGFLARNYWRGKMSFQLTLLDLAVA